LAVPNTRRADGRLIPDVRYWHLADIDATLTMSAFGGKADIADERTNVR